MGMFDEVRPVNITQEGFDRSHNLQVFQTKDLGCEMKQYCIFNGVLYLEEGQEGAGDFAAPEDFSGTLDIYTHVTSGDATRWVEYALTFQAGRLTGAKLLESTVTEDSRDLAALRPAKPRNRVEVTIDVSELSRDRQDAFIARLSDEKLAAIRTLLEEPTATVFYPVRPETGGYHNVFSLHPRVMTVASVVQTPDDLRDDDSVKGKNSGVITAPNGDRIVFADELSALWKSRGDSPEKNG